MEFGSKSRNTRQPIIEYGTGVSCGFSQADGTPCSMLASKFFKFAGCQLQALQQALAELLQWYRYR